MMGLSSALEPLRSFNRLTGRKAYDWLLASLDGAPVAASNGIPLPSIRWQEALDRASYFFICSGIPIKRSDERRYLNVLREAARRHIPVGSLATGSYLLARAGLLDGYRCTIHWESRAAFQEEFPEIACSAKIYEIDRDRLTCSGGTAAMDLMLHLIAERYGAALARGVANQFLHERIRDDREDQRGGQLESGMHFPAKLRAAIAAMQRSVEDPCSLPSIAKATSLSPRQLERLFVRYAGMTPLRYYMQLRLDRARELLLYSDKPIIEVAISAGFSSNSHFASWYKRFFGMRPSEARGRWHQSTPAMRGLATRRNPEVTESSPRSKGVNTEKLRRVQ